MSSSFLPITFLVFFLFYMSENTFAQTNDPNTLRQINRLVNQIDIQLNQIEPYEFRQKRKRKPIGNCYYQKKAGKIHHLTQKLEKYLPKVEAGSHLQELIQNVIDKGKDIDNLAIQLKEHDTKLGSELNGIKFQIPSNLSGGKWESYSTGDKLAMIGLILLLLAIPAGLIWWGIARQLVFPFVLLGIYAILLWLVTAFMKGLRSAFRR